DDQSTADQPANLAKEAPIFSLLNKIQRIFNILFILLFVLELIISIAVLAVPNYRQGTIIVALLFLIFLFSLLPCLVSNYFFWLLRKLKFSPLSIIIMNVIQGSLFMMMFLISFIGAGLSNDAAEAMSPIFFISLFFLTPAIFFNIVYFIAVRKLSLDKRHLITPLVFILLEIVIICLSFIFQPKTLDNIYKLSSESNPASPTPALTANNSSGLTPTNGDEENWKAYTNISLGISLKYPSNYKILGENDNFVDIFSPLDSQNPNPNISSNDLRVTIEKELAGKNQTLDQFIKNRLGSDTGINNRSETTIGDLNAIKIESKSLNTGDEGMDFFISKGNYFYVISKTPLETSRQNEFNQILSTFTFIKQ
ncbi:hypothetical protein HZB78_04630, partial [Candidatus Collierbacteria bacterium]|nr:hypothetical protein [Candidatus Collierbacteria bacterium]